MSKKSILGAVAVLAVAALCFLSYNWGRNRAISSFEQKVDTLFVFDTIVEIKPKEVVKRVCIHDSILIQITDTLKIHDTTYISLPREEKVYQDSLYRAVVSGYHPSLDSIDIYRTTITETKYKVVKDKFSFGINAGVGVGYNGKFVATPYIGLGVSYHIFSW